MMKFLTTALGGLTMLAVTGMATAPGQAMLGLQRAQTAAPVSVISDPGPQKFVAPAAAPATPAPASTTPALAPTAAPHPAVAAPVAPRPAVARPVARPAAPAATSVPAAGAAPAANPMGGLGGAGAITNILLNLPQVLQQGGGSGGDEGHGGPGWIPPGQRTKWKHHNNGNGNDQGGEDVPER